MHPCHLQRPLLVLWAGPSQVGFGVSPCCCIISEVWLQMYEDSGRTLLPNWPGWRALVTDSQGQQQWVNMPTEGQQTFLKDFMSGGTAGVLPGCLKIAARPSCLLSCAALLGPWLGGQRLLQHACLTPALAPVAFLCRALHHAPV